jgi:hypothetical protein
MPPSKFEIIFNPETGAITVNGPLHDKIFCFGLLEAAKMIVAQHQPAQQPPIVVPNRAADGVGVVDKVVAKILRGS